LNVSRRIRTRARLAVPAPEYGVPVNGTLSAIAIGLSLLLAVWSFVTAARDRAPDRLQLIGLGVVEASLVALLAAALVSVAGGERPASAGTFVGYTITALLLPVLGWILARMEPTRWGAVIIGAVCLTVPVLVLRLQQTWSAVTSG
jgi:hypothetical protein